jgi:hypothetical protein
MAKEKGETMLFGLSGTELAGLCRPTENNSGVF